MIVRVQWTESTEGDWCELTRLNLSTAPYEGVYIIWVADYRGIRTIRVGQGDVDERLREHKNDKKILAACPRNATGE